MSRSARWVPPLIVGTGVLHTGLGLVADAPLGDILDAGVIDSIDGDAEREAAFWYAATGVFMVALGELARWTVRETDRLPARLGGWLVGTGVTGILLMPASGFWLFLPPAVAASRRAARGRGRAGMEAPSTGENTPGGSSAPHPNPAGRLEPRRAQAPGHSRE